MNSLTILIYLTQIVPSIGTMFGVFAFFGTGILIVWIIGAIITKAEDLTPVINFPKKRYFVFVISCIIFTNVIPDRTTMILMASSEVAQKIVTSDKMNQIVDKNLDPAINLLNVWITEKTKELSTKK